MKYKTQRLLFVIFSMVCLAGAVALLLVTFNDNLVFFHSPTDLQQKEVPAGKLIRIGGLVEEGSVVQKEGSMDIRFNVTDMQHSIAIHYTGILPNLFREGQGMVAEGHVQKDGSFRAVRLLAKHDEKYMPPEVADALKEAGHWKGGREE